MASKRKAKKRAVRVVRALDYGGVHGPGFHLCTASDMHPYNCDYATCVHCKRVKDDRHDPERCALCNYAEDKP